jgi:hypothetical protein
VLVTEYRERLSEFTGQGQMKSSGNLFITNTKSLQHGVKDTRFETLAEV